MTASITLHHMTPFDHTAEIIIINVLRPWGREATRRGRPTPQPGAPSSTM